MATLEISQVTLTAPKNELDVFSGNVRFPPDLTPTEFTANVSPTTECWRLVHDGVNVKALFFGSGETTTRNELVCADTKEELLAVISDLGLKPLPLPGVPDDISEADLIAAMESDPVLIRQIVRRIQAQRQGGGGVVTPPVRIPPG